MGEQYTPPDNEREAVKMFAFFNLIFMGILWAGYEIKEQNTPESPAIKDMNKFAKETIGMSPEEIKKGLRDGRW